MDNPGFGHAKRLAKELRELRAEPIDGLRVHINDDSFADIRAELDGPASTPFDGGTFKLRLVLTSSFPTTPPRAYFTTKIFHPNVSTSGEICVNTLKRDWRNDVGLRHVFMVIRCLLIDPNPESALNEDAGRLLLEDYEEYARIARVWTEVHARRARPAHGASAAGADGGGAQNRSAANVDSAAPQGGVGAAAATPATFAEADDATALAAKKKAMNKRRLKRL